LRFDHPAKDLVERAYSKTLGAKVLRKADKVITISDSDRGYVHSFGVPLKRIEVIPNGVDVARYNCQKNDLPERMLLEGKQVILFVGPLIKRKGPQVLVHAIPKIVKENPDAVFVFVGKGDFKEEVEKLSHTLQVDKYTRFLGYVPDDQLHLLYQRSEALVLPSFSEALSYTILDAFVFSKPVISSLIPCIKDHLSETAMLVQPGDSEALADAVLRLLHDRELAKELGASGRRLVETRFTWDAVVRHVERIYREVLDSP
jgi:glycosyltransferase involved in cell wall biosynthesis